jgi:hypothetical protein
VLGHHEQGPVRIGRSYELHTDREAVGAVRNRHYKARQTDVAGEVGPAGLVEEAPFDAVDRERTAPGWDRRGGSGGRNEDVVLTVGEEPVPRRSA